MPVYNGQDYLDAAITSILRQTWQNWELIIVDDGSTDCSIEKICAYKDHRIRSTSNQRGKGVAAALNTGIDLAVGQFIARMDADDISRPDRLAQQVAHLIKNPQVTVCGTWVKYFGSSQGQWEYPVTDNRAKARLIFAPPFAHPTVMMKAELFDNGCRYDEECGYVEDYELWTRIMNTACFANLPLPLLDYRLHDQQVGKCMKEHQKIALVNVQKKIFVKLGLIPDHDELATHKILSAGTPIKDMDGLLRAEQWLGKISAANQNTSVFDQDALNEILFAVWWEACHLALPTGAKVWATYHNSMLRGYCNLSKFEEWKFALRSLCGTRGKM